MSGKILKGLQGLRAFMLANAYGHLWVNAITEIAGQRVSDDATPEEFSDAIKAVIQKGVELDEIAERTAAINESQVIPGIEAPDFDEEYGSITHTTNTGRLSWEIAPNGTVAFTVSRPFGDVLQAWVHDDSTFDAEYLAAADGGRNVRYRHVLALGEAVRVLLPGADVAACFPEVPSAPEAELAADVLEQVLKNPALRDQKYIVANPIQLTLEVSDQGWRVVSTKTVMEQA